MTARIVLALLILTGPIFAQASDRYIVTREATALSNASEVVTLQQPATGAKTVEVVAFVVQCSVTCAVYVDRDGTAATTTNATIVKVNPSVSPTPGFSAFYASDVGTGTSRLTPSYTLAANQILTLDMKGTYLGPAGKNVSVHVGPITGNATIQVLADQRR